MLDYLSGKLKEKGEAYCIIEMGGVGVRAEVSKTTAAELPKKGKRVTLWTVLELKERDSSFALFGFQEKRERDFFMRLRGVSGVGARGALAILSQADIRELEGAIAAEEPELLMRVSGIGKKKAEKIILELKEYYEGGAQASTETVEVLDALKRLGYSAKEAREAVHALPEGIEDTEAKVRAALKHLGNTG